MNIIDYTDDNRMTTSLKVRMRARVEFNRVKHMKLKPPKLISSEECDGADIQMVRNFTNKQKENNQ